MPLYVPIAYVLPIHILATQCNLADISVTVSYSLQGKQIEN